MQGRRSPAAEDRAPRTTPIAVPDSTPIAQQHTGGEVAAASIAGRSA